MAGFKGALVKAGEAAGEGVLDVAAVEVLLEQSDQKEGEQPNGAVAENVGGKEHASVEDQKSGSPEGQDEKRKAYDPPNQPGEEVRKLPFILEPIHRDRAALDLRHDPGDEKNYEAIKRLDEERHQWGYCGAGGRGIRDG